MKRRRGRPESPAPEPCPPAAAGARDGAHREPSSDRPGSLLHLAYDVLGNGAMTKRLMGLILVVAVAVGIVAALVVGIVVWLAASDAVSHAPAGIGSTVASVLGVALVIQIRSRLARGKKDHPKEVRADGGTDPNAEHRR
jgi:hypothetical protein